jgi:hypothetical protein
MEDTVSATIDDALPSKEELESKAIALALKVINENETWAQQDRAVYTSEVMERELDRLFPVETFLERKKHSHEGILKLPEDR